MVGGDRGSSGALTCWGTSCGAALQESDALQSEVSLLTADRSRLTREVRRRFGLQLDDAAAAYHPHGLMRRSHVGTTWSCDTWMWQLHGMNGCPVCCAAHRQLNLKTELEAGWALRAGQQATALKESQAKVAALEKSLQQVRPGRLGGVSGVCSWQRSLAVPDAACPFQSTWALGESPAWMKMAWACQAPCWMHGARHLAHRVVPPEPATPWRCHRCCRTLLLSAPPWWQRPPSR